jgi:hypothetical protein
MNAPTELPIKLTSFAHGGGCGCKIAPGLLGEILKGAKGIVPPQLLVGIETSDDAAVYQLNDEQALIATTDFFMPIVDDPYDFGRIAATNAISDVYAMGGTPLFALALVGMPIDKLPVETIRRILDGGEAVCARAGIPIAGGHTIDSVEPIYGLVVIGLVDPKHLKRNAGAQPGERPAAGSLLGHVRQLLNMGSRPASYLPAPALASISHSRNARRFLPLLAESGNERRAGQDGTEGRGTGGMEVRPVPEAATAAERGNQASRSQAIRPSSVRAKARMPIITPTTTRAATHQ